MSVPQEDRIDFSRILDLNTSDVDAQREIAEYCKIDLARIDVAMVRHPGLYAYAVANHEMAKVREAQAKYEMESALATAFDVLMTNPPPGVEKAKTATEAEKRVKTMPSVIEATKKLHSAMALSARLKGIVLGLDHRKDMLVQIASRQRAELQNG